MDIHFKDGTKSAVAHMGDINCDGNFYLFLGDAFQNKPLLEKLKSAKISSVAITYTNSENGKLTDTVEEFSFSDEQAKIFVQGLNCLSNIKK